ncbi:MAG: hypothetical protein RTV41_02565 [Candidatus Thorarchaeota archaeon]
MTTEPQKLDPEELALCQLIAAVTERTLSEWLEKKPLFEVSWREQQKESSWSPALSIIPVSRKSSFRSNVTVLQRLRFKGGEEDVLVLYKATTPRDDTVIVTGLEVGTLVDVVVPRGVHVGSGGWTRFENNEDQKNQRKETPLDAVLRTEFQNTKKSKLVQTYVQLTNSSEYVTTVRLTAPRKTLTINSPRGLFIMPYYDKTIVVATSCACPPNGFKRKIELRRGTVNYEFGAPNDNILRSAINIVGQLSRLIKDYACDYPVSTTFESVEGLLSLYLMLEASRRKYKPEENALTLSEILGYGTDDRISDLMNSIKGESS